jgi:hypothetical protein
VQHFQHRFSVNVWCGLIGPYLIGPYIFVGALNGRNYLDFLQNELNALLEDVPLALRLSMFFQHDGAPPHYHNAVRTHLNTMYHRRWIGRGGPIAWPARSPDLSPLDFYLWGEYKRLIYENRPKPLTRDELLGRIHEATVVIKQNQDVLQRSSSQLFRRATLCINENGGHFEQLLH